MLFLNVVIVETLFRVSLKHRRCEPWALQYKTQFSIYLWECICRPAVMNPFICSILKIYQMSIIQIQILFKALKMEQE